MLNIVPCGATVLEKYNFLVFPYVSLLVIVSVRSLDNIKSTI